VVPVACSYFQCTDPRFRFINLDYFGVKGVIGAHMQPPFSDGYDGMSDSELVLEVSSVLVRMFALKAAVTPVRWRVTRWDTDEFAGCGSYSYFKVGSSQDDIVQLKQRAGPLFFAGEACSETEAQCIHGAVGTGDEVAHELLDLLRPVKEDGPVTFDTKPAVPMAAPGTPPAVPTTSATVLTGPSTVH
jgi:monoamine oxidase